LRARAEPVLPTASDAGRIADKGKPEKEGKIKEKKRQLILVERKATSPKKKG